MLMYMSECVCVAYLSWIEGEFIVATSDVAEGYLSTALSLVDGRLHHRNRGRTW